MGLNHPRDLYAWRQWQARQASLPSRARGRVRSALDAAGFSTSPTLALTAITARPRIVVCLESRSPTSVLALLMPLKHLPLDQVGILSPTPVRDLLPRGDWSEVVDDFHDLIYRVIPESRVVLSTGHYLPVGGTAQDITEPRQHFVTVQHGLLTPQAPPLASSATLLAFSDADADFWRSGRDDVATHTVGSQLLWDAFGSTSSSVDPAAPPVFLGQLHGAELPRNAMAQSAQEFCLDTGATYRPHPSETDRLSRRAHDRFESLGIAIDRSGTPLTSLGAPVVSAFSTGVLEAAAHGIPAWVHFRDAPPWLHEFWDRYGLAPWGGAPTAPPARPTIEPSRAVADHVLALLGEST